MPRLTRWTIPATAGAMAALAWSAVAAEPSAGAQVRCPPAELQPREEKGGGEQNPEPSAANGENGPETAGSICRPTRAVIPWEFDLPFGRSIRLRAYLQYDLAHYAQRPAGPPETDFRRGTVGEQPNAEALAMDLENGGLLRRARVGADGRLGPNFAYRIMFEVGGGGRKGESRVTESWLSYNRFSPITVQAGAFAQPANLDDVTSAQDLLFVERATAAEVARSLGAGDGRLGVSVKYTDDLWAAAVSLTGPVFDHSETFTAKGAVVARVSRAVTVSEEGSVRIGVSGTHVLAPATGDATARSVFPTRFRNRPEVRVDSTRLIDTGDLSSAHADAFGMELAAQRRNFYVQAEAFWLGVERRRPASTSNPKFSGFYLQGSWVLTGERRRYSPTNGSFRNPTPSAPLGRSGGLGAWEVALRYSRMNLNYHEGSVGQAPPPDGVRGGDQRILTVGVNWYPTAKAKVMLDYMHVAVDRLNPASPSDPTPFGPTPYTPPIGVQIGQTLNIVVMRLQYVF